MKRNQLYYENRIKNLSNRKTECIRIINKLRRKLKSVESQQVD